MIPVSRREQKLKSSVFRTTVFEYRISQSNSTPELPTFEKERLTTDMLGGRSDLNSSIILSSRRRFGKDPSVKCADWCRGCFGLVAVARAAGRDSVLKWRGDWLERDLEVLFLEVCPCRSAAALLCWRSKSVGYPSKTETREREGLFIAVKTSFGRSSICIRPVSTKVNSFTSTVVSDILLMSIQAPARSMSRTLNGSSRFFFEFMTFDTFPALGMAPPLAAAFISCCNGLELPDRSIPHSPAAFSRSDCKAAASSATPGMAIAGTSGAPSGPSDIDSAPDSSSLRESSTASVSMAAILVVRLTVAANSTFSTLHSCKMTPGTGLSMKETTFDASHIQSPSTVWRRR
mmetsp:Transcript_16912/g.40082  ORF Transcript_16912/g.40082 Transcript_16912/m.40082 type:complete len:347 (+) Transcript_16912:2683-3723(+)